MHDEEELLIYTLFVLIMGIYIIKKRQSFRWTNRNYWVRPINIRRPNQGDFYQLFQELKDDPDMFFRYTRMSLSASIKISSFSFRLVSTEVFWFSESSIKHSELLVKYS